MTTNRSPVALVDLAKGSIFAKTFIAVAPERVFMALSTDEVSQWWGDANTYRTTKMTSDLRPGGAWKSEGVGSDGSTFSVGGTYLEVDPPRRLVQTWISSWDSQVTTLTYRLDAVDGGTMLSIQHEGFGDAQDSCEQHAKGWEQVLGWLTEHLQPSRAFAS